MEQSLLIVCETGISAALFVSKTLEEIRIRNLNYDIDYAQTEKLEKKLSIQSFDHILLTPQLHNKYSYIEDLLKENNKNSEIHYLSEEDYKYMKISKILDNL